MNSALAQWNEADGSSAMGVMLSCCGARRWADAMADSRPIPDEMVLHTTADRIWDSMNESDWAEAFACHPKIGERKNAQQPDQASRWSGQEQSSVATATDTTLAQLEAGNALYESIFGFTYIVCATGKSAEEMIAILNRRLRSDRALELREAAEQQRQIMHIRLRKWFDQ